MKVLVTGGNGFLGSILTRMLLTEGYQVAILDLSPVNKILSPKEREQIEFIQGDLGNMAHVMDAVNKSKCETIFHIGSMLSVPSETNPQAAFMVNAVGSYNIFEAARILGVNKVLFASSMSVFGLDLKGDVIDDATLQRPTTAYGIHKAFIENLGRYYEERYGLDFRAARFCSIVGPGSRTKHISVHNSWIIEKSFYGQPFEVFVEPYIKTSLLYCKDAARALILLDKAPREDIKTICYNVQGFRISAGDLVEKVKQRLPEAQLTYKPEEKIMNSHLPRQNMVYDDSKARTEWGWQPHYLADELIDDFIQVLKDNYEFYKS